MDHASSHQVKLVCGKIPVGEGEDKGNAPPDAAKKEAEAQHLKQTSRGRNLKILHAIYPMMEDLWNVYGLKG